MFLNFLILKLFYVLCIKKKKLKTLLKIVTEHARGIVQVMQLILSPLVKSLSNSCKLVVQ